MTGSRKSCLGPAEIASFVFLVLFKDGGRRMSLRFHLFVSDVIQENEEAGGFRIFLRDAWDGEILGRSSGGC